MRRPVVTCASVRLAPIVVMLMMLGSMSAMAEEVLRITRDTVLDPCKTYGEIVIEASGVTIDGRGAWLIGPAARLKARAKPADFRGVAIHSKGVSSVRLRNLNAKGWATGLAIEDGPDWHVEGCNFSDNFHDPEFGCGENGRRGGRALTRAGSSTIRRCRANRVWDACVPVDSADNAIEDNDFSHASNTARSSSAPRRAIASGATI